jgi:hypothetical protein
MPTRPEVYAAVDSERAYQDLRWNESTTSCAGVHTATEFLVFMRDYIEEAMRHVSRNAEPGATEFVLHSIRKVTGLGVACMEQNGAPHRKVLE